MLPILPHRSPESTKTVTQQVHRGKPTGEYFLSLNLHQQVNTIGKGKANPPGLPPTGKTLDVRIKSHRRKR
jgi:hypothetical protein